MLNTLGMISVLSDLRLILPKTRTCLLQCIQTRFSSYKSSPFLVDIGKVDVKYSVSTSPEDWKYVERILPPVTVPTPKSKPNYPSQWKPQAENLNYPYIIQRTKNHMLPVYLEIGQHGIRRITRVKRIQGDIWALENDLREFLQKGTIKPIRSQVNEFAGYIRFYGDHVNAIKHWLMEKNF